jgi:peptidoglycan/xylan/chitin deacetylase (PgdA/CDA1 family)
MRLKNSTPLEAIKGALQAWRRGAPFVVLNFHRVGPSLPSDPFRHLDTISAKGFKSTLTLLRFFFQVVSLADVVEASRETRRPRLLLTFDDVSRTFLENALPLLEQYNLPVALFPCVRITETGSGWRDLVYYLLDAPDLQPVIRQRVERVLGQRAVRQLQEQGLYQWSKRVDHPTALVEKEILLPALGERHRQFEDLVLREQPYLGWSDLKRLAGHPLVTIGSHGTRHHDYRGLGCAEIRRDVSEAQEHIAGRLGFAPQHFSLPFGSHDQRVWQTLDQALPAFGIKTAFWCENYANTGRHAGSRVLHWSRLNAKSSAIRNLRYCAKALSRPLSSLIDVFPPARLAGEGRFDTKVSEDDYRHLHLLLMPGKRRHQSPEYYAYLFKDNPFRDPADPAHLGLYYEDNLEAVISLLWVRFAVQGRPVKGAYLSGWWRLPQIHSPVGTRPFLAMARAASPVLGAYPKGNKYSGPLIERDGWHPVPVDRFEGPLTNLNGPANYRVSETYPPEIGALLDTVNASVHFSIWRDRRFYEWRFERYPFLKYRYLFDAGPDPSWFALVASDGKRLSLSDFAVTGPADEAVWRGLLSSVADYLQNMNVQQVALETSNETLRRVCLSLGWKPKAITNYYCFAPELEGRSAGALSAISGLHETQATSDILPLPR